VSLDAMRAALAEEETRLRESVRARRARIAHEQERLLDEALALVDLRCAALKVGAGAVLLLNGAPVPYAPGTGEAAP